MVSRDIFVTITFGNKISYLELTAIKSISKSPNISSDLQFVKMFLFNSSYLSFQRVLYIHDAIHAETVLRFITGSKVNVNENVMDLSSNDLSNMHKQME